jgi:drug/metabolite transporter (DMT)-like permease
MNQPDAAGRKDSSWKPGQGAILLCAFLWSTSGLFIKLVDWNPVTIAGSRSFLAALFLFALRLPQRRRGCPAGRAAGRPPFESPQSRRLSGRDIFFTFAGGIAYASTMIVFVIANKRTTSANAILLQYTAPVWAALLGWVIAGERPRWEQWAALALVFFGMFLFFKDDLGGGSFFGDVLAIVSGIAFGAHSVFLRMIKRGKAADAMLLSHILCALFSVPFFFLYPPVLSPGTAGAIFFMGIVQIGAASALFAYGIRRVTALQAMLTAMIEPALNPVWVFAVTGEKPAVSALTGGGVIIAALILSAVISARRDRQMDLPRSGRQKKP